MEEELRQPMPTPMPGSASQSTMAQSLRERQRDRLSPRGRLPKPGRISTTVREVDRSLPKNRITLSPAPAPRLKAATGKRTPDLIKKKQLEDGLRKENSISRRARKEAEDGKWDLTPEGGSAGREGRQFTVANVGNNGRIYLRPTIRPANQRYPQPSFVFPATPPSITGLDVAMARKDEGDSTRGSLWTPSRSPSTPARNGMKQYFPDLSASAQRKHRRAFSHSTIEESQIPVQDSDIGAFKVVIERPSTGGPSKSLELTQGIPTLEVPIPSYKLGTPRFSMRGTAFLRNSSYTGTDDIRSSIFSSGNPSRSSRLPNQVLSRRHSDTSPQPYLRTNQPSSPMIPSPMIMSGVIRQSTPITPEMFDALTFKPACDHPSVVRYSTNGGIRAATPARLVAEITSPTFVDYDLLSDFFLTYRSFLDTSDLLHMVLARLKWALVRDDEIGTVVRVRTFVAMRHWILNYFLDDFVIDHDLRTAFCKLLNGLVEELSKDPAQSKVPLKVVGELKKCWRRVCALYWDSNGLDTEVSIDVPITPGGIAGHRNPKLDPSFWDTHPDGPPQLEGIIEPDFVEYEPDSSAVQAHNFFADVSRAGHIDSVIAMQNMPSAQVESPMDDDELPSSPGSIMSEDFVSCSFPSRTRTAASAQPVGAHPVIASSVYESSPAIATTPKALTGKRVRPTHSHQRSGSLSDSMRDQRTQPVQKVIYKSTEILLALPYAGSLVRGNLFPPGQAFVEEITPGTPADAHRATTLFPGTPAPEKGSSAMSGPGMKKLLGSVRRALSTKSPCNDSSPTQGSFPFMPPLGVRGATINRLPGTAVVPQARARNTGTRGPMRIDILGAEIAEDFKKAVREDAESDAERRQALERTSIEQKDSEHESSLGGERNKLQYPEMHPDLTVQSDKPNHSRFPGSELTNGSKSIVIFDDTLTPQHSAMTGALPISTSVDTFADVFMHPSGGLTPPSTPPELPLGTPRRSSHLLGEATRTRSFSVERTPSLVEDIRGSNDGDQSPSDRTFTRPSLKSPRSFGHVRSYSSKTKKSGSLRRYASFQSGITRDQTERSFDASSFSGDLNRMSSVQAVPLPLRVLRRRPGGDLRAVTNVDDLNIQPLRRPMSTGSLATYSESVRSSFLLGADSSDYVGVVSSDYDESKSNMQTFSLGQLAQPTDKARVSLFSTHSSQPRMRPSFEKEAQMLAQIPDDINDDGGVESALLKLEGKYEQRYSNNSDASPHAVPGSTNSFGGPHFDVSTLTLEGEEEKYNHRMKHIVESGISKTPPAVETYRPQKQTGEELKPSVYQPTGMHSAPIVTTRSVESYSSIPLLERGLSMDRNDRRRSHEWDSVSAVQHSSDQLQYTEQTPESSHPSYEFVSKTDSMGRIPVDSTNPGDEDSLLDSDIDDDQSDLSSEMSLEVISRAEFTAHNPDESSDFPPLGPGTVIKEMPLPSHPLRHPPSPPMTLVQALRLSPDAANVTQARDAQLHYQPRSPLPPTPEITPTLSNGVFGDRGASPTSPSPLNVNEVIEASRKTSMHLPFILAFDSQILAQQFTLIEKDALNEIDWKDLIEMRWKETQTESRSWVEFLRTSEPRGVEVVIARFNLMVKWAVSEIVLTQDLEERVRCIIKYIHIAAHCRKYRNFATMTQLTVALTSKDISRLTHTWSYIPAADMKTLNDMEALVTPTSNFHSLRAEMEGSGADRGCIPFVGIYTHDLLINAERPSHIASTPTTEPLVNFERCRTDAAIVKNLLRLLEASQLYRFLPIEGVTERCLWMAALSDAEIVSYGKTIQA
ncbi:RasGEF domain-containing protein [Phlyctema vagabunda]|uniref:RasGEF domain-containing protein n=1 Tax=Phlyctema vagabunda TaxID=108571 RepID=A0ABR4PXT5_9HELO